MNDLRVRIWVESVHKCSHGEYSARPPWCGWCGAHPPSDADRARARRIQWILNEFAAALIGGTPSDEPTSGILVVQ